MAALPSIKELRSMQMNDLQSEIAEHAKTLAKMRLDVALGSEKDTAKLRRLRKALARMETVKSEKVKGDIPELKKKRKSSRVSAPAHA